MYILQISPFDCINTGSTSFRHVPNDGSHDYNTTRRKLLQSATPDNVILYNSSSPETSQGHGPRLYNGGVHVGEAPLRWQHGSTHARGTAARKRKLLAYDPGCGPNSGIILCAGVTDVSALGMLNFNYDYTTKGAVLKAITSSTGGFVCNNCYASINAGIWIVYFERVVLPVKPGGQR